MSCCKAIHSTFVLERKLKASPERVFAAFADPATNPGSGLASGLPGGLRD